MFDNLLNLVKEHAGEAIVKNPAIPNEHNDAAISETTNSIMNSLKGQASGGNTDNLMSMFSGGSVDEENPVVKQVSGNAITDLMKKFGIDNAQASSIVSSIIPTVMGKLVSKTNDKNDSSFSLDGIMSSLGGSGLGSMLGGLTDKLKF